MLDKLAEIGRPKRLIILGTELGFMDDVAHHTEELEKLQNE